MDAGDTGGPSGVKTFVGAPQRETGTIGLPPPPPARARRVSSGAPAPRVCYTPRRDRARARRQTCFLRDNCAHAITRGSAGGGAGGRGSDCLPGSVGRCNTVPATRRRRQVRQTGRSWSVPEPARGMNPLGVREGETPSLEHASLRMMHDPGSTRQRN